MFTLKQLSIGNILEEQFILKVFNSEDVKLFWSPNTKRQYTFDGLLKTFNSQIGNYIIYIGYKYDSASSIFMLHSISTKNKRAEILVFVDKNNRSSCSTFSWWVLFLDKIRKIGINRIYAKIFSINQVSLKSALHYTFYECGLLPEYIYYNQTLIDAHILTRETQLTNSESYWLNKIS